MPIPAWNVAASYSTQYPLVFSNNNRTVASTNNFGEKDVIPTIGIKPNTGKFYWEFNYNVDNGGLDANVPFVGMTDLFQPISVPCPTSHTWGLVSNGKAYNGNVANGIYNGGNIGGGNAIAFAYDSGTNIWWAGLPSAGGGNWFGGGNPAAGTGGLGTTTVSTIYPLFQTGSGTDIIFSSILGWKTINGNPPNGFLSLGWEPTPPNIQQLSMANHRWKY